MNLDRLISRIRAALRDGADAVTLRALAEAYAAHAKRAAARLDACIPLLRAEQKYAVLQMAETEPPLLDCIARLSFDGMDAWNALCAQNDLPQAPVFEPLLIAQINALYGEQIDESHPLYRDYRAAMRLRDEVGGLRVLNAILRMHPDDANAQSEALRLRPRVRATLRARAENADDAALEPILDARESLGLADDADNDDFWRAAHERRAAITTRRAEARARELCDALRPLVAARDWENAMPLLAEWESLCADFSENFAAKCESEIAPMRAWADGEAARRARENAQRRRIENATALLETSPETFPEMENALSRWDALAEEQGDEPWPPPFDTAIPAHRRALRGKILRRRARVVGGATVLFCALLAAGVFLEREFSQWRDCRAYYAHLEQLKETGDISGLATALNAEENGVFRERRLADWQAYAAWHAEQARAADAIACEIEALRAKDVAAVAAARETLDAAQKQADALMAGLLNLPRGVRTAFAAQIESVKRAWQTAFDARENAAHATAEALVEKSESFARNAAALTDENWRAFEALVPSLRAIDPQRGALFDRAQAAISAYESGIVAFRAREAALAALDEARDLPAYLGAVESLAENPLTPTEEQAYLRAARATPERLRAFLKSAMPPEASRLWQALQAGELNEAFTPRTTLAAENLPLSRLFGDKTVDRLARRIVTHYDKRGIPESAETLYTVGDVETEQNIWSGGEEIRQTVAVLDASGSPTPRTFRRVKFRGDAALSGDGVGEALPAPETRLWRKLRRYFDTRANAAQGALLEGLDTIRADADASPLFKAALHLQWVNALRARPEVWGVAFCPQVEADALELAAIVGDTPSLYAFASPETRRLLAADTAAFYEKTRGSYLDAARAALSQKRAALRDAPQFAGYYAPKECGARTFRENVWYLPENAQTPRRYDPTQRAAPPPYAAFFTLSENLERMASAR